MPILCQTSRNSRNSYFTLPWAREGLSKLGTKSKSHKAKNGRLNHIETQKPLCSKELHHQNQMANELTKGCDL